MPPKKKAPSTSLGFYPMLKKTAVAVGKQCSVPGKYWAGCSASDKDKRYLCTVIEFIALHDFGGGIKGAGFQVKEMGEDGKGSLELGVASGEVFILAYPHPFLEYYWYANRSELDAPVRLKLFPTLDVVVAGDAGAAETVVEEPEQIKKETVRPPVFNHLELVSSTLNVSGPKRGAHTNKYKCTVALATGQCGASITLYATGDGKSETTSNAWKHMRDKASAGCVEHKAVLANLNLTNRNVVVDANGESVLVMNFEEAFPHHVDYVWCRAQGILSAKAGFKPMFRKYVRGYEPRAVFPNSEVQFSIALCIKELQDEEQRARLAALQKDFKMGPCIGLQLDMWTDPHTHVAYAGVNVVTVHEPMVTVHEPSSAGSPGVSSKTMAVPQLLARSEVLDFDVFPNTEHTGIAIRNWFESLLAGKGIKIDCISGVTPDGASDGQCGLAMITGLAQKVDTCNLHGLQRSVQYSLGLAGSGSTLKNPEAKALLKGHNRIAQLKNQSRAVSDGLRKAQLAEDIPLSKVLTTVDTCTTRWGNQFEQVSRANTLRPVIDPVVDAFKRENRGKKDAIVENDDDNPTSRLGKPVPVTAIGLSSEDWDRSLELEAFLDHPYQIKESIEHKGYVTGATSLFLLNDLMKGCGDEKSLTVKLHPSTAKLADRQRQPEERKADALHELTKTARAEMTQQLAARFFEGERPSDTRLVQIWMSKQRPAEKWMPKTWHILAKGLYYTMLRQAAKIAGIGLRTSPPRKQQKKTPGSISLVRNDSDDEDGDAAMQAGGEHFDTVTDEAHRWSSLDKATILKHTDSAGIVNEFALLYDLRTSFPLHYIVFKQTASHIPHEGNSEQLFSRAGNLSDDNGKMDPARLGVWTSIGVNYAIFQPSVKAILERYLIKFGKGGTTQVHEDDLGLIEEPEEDTGTICETCIN